MVVSVNLADVAICIYGIINQMLWSVIHWCVLACKLPVSEWTGSSDFDYLFVVLLYLNNLGKFPTYLRVFWIRTKSLTLSGLGGVSVLEVYSQSIRRSVCMGITISPDHLFMKRININSNIIHYVPPKGE